MDAARQTPAPPCRVPQGSPPPAVVRLISACGVTLPHARLATSRLPFGVQLTNAGAPFPILSAVGRANRGAPERVRRSGRSMPRRRSREEKCIGRVVGALLGSGRRQPFPALLARLLPFRRAISLAYQPSPPPALGRMTAATLPVAAWARSSLARPHCGAPLTHPAQ